jgi:hypothetical protein
MPACPCGGGRSLSSWLLFRCPIRAQTPGNGFMEPRRLERSESPATRGVKPHRATGRHHAPARLPSLVMKGSPVRVRARLRFSEGFARCKSWSDATHANTLVVVLRLHEAVGRFGSRADDDPGAVAGEPLKRDEARIADLSAAAEELGLRSGA